MEQPNKEFTKYNWKEQDFEWMLVTWRLGLAGWWGRRLKEAETTFLLLSSRSRTRPKNEGSRDHVGYLPFRFSGLMESGKQNLKETFGLNSGAYNQAAFGLIYFLM